MSRVAFVAAVALASVGAVGLVAAQEAPPAPPAAPPAAPAAAPAAAAQPAGPPPLGPIVPTPPEETTPAVAAPAAAPASAAAPAAPAPPPKPAEPMKRPRLGAAVLQAVDKITAETLRFEARVGEPVRYKGLVITVRSCETTAADEPDFDSIAALDVVSRPEGVAGRAASASRTVFRGWSFASSPGLHPFVHPTYDLWVIACKAAAPSA